MANTPTPPTVKHVLSGTIRTRKGHPVPHLTVKAYDKKAGRRLWSIGKSQTDAQGFYQIYYRKKVTEAMEEFGADLLVRVYNTDKDLLVESPVLVNAPQEAQINVSVADEVFRGPSAFERLQERIGALVDPDELWELDEEDVAYLAAKLKMQADKVQPFCSAFQWEAATKKWGKKLTISATTFYALMQEEEELRLAELVGRRKAVLRRRLQDAVERELIPELGEEQIEGQLEQLKELAVAMALQEVEGEDYSLKALLDTLPDLSVQAKEAYIRRSVLAEEEEESGRQSNNEKAKETKEDAAIADIIRMADLAGKNLSLVRAQQAELQDAVSTEYQALRHFAKQPKKEWNDFLKKHKVRLPKGENGRRISRTDYAEQLTETFKGAFPMVDLLQVIQTSKLLSTSRRPSAAFLQFFDQNADFSLNDHSIADFWDKANLKGMKKQQQAPLQEELRSWQRAYKLLPDNERRHEAAVTLMALQPPLDSAMKIAGISKSSFSDQWIKAGQTSSRLDAAALRLEAELIHQRAQMLSFMLSATAWKYAAPLDAIRPVVVPPMIQKAARENGLEKTTSNLLLAQDYLYDDSTLLDRPYYYEVPDCQSILSPAAYLQELLGMPQPAEASSNDYPKVASEISDKRPDILLILATAQNTETKLPYIDLVNEQLERFLAKGQRGEWSYDLQTTKSADELALEPENEFTPVYMNLATSRKAMTLPWDKWYTEANLYLDYLGLPLQELVEHSSPLRFINSVFDYRNWRTNQLNSLPALRALLGMVEADYAFFTNAQFNEAILEAFGIDPSSESQPGGGKGKKGKKGNPTLQAAGKLTKLMPKLGFWQGNQEGDAGTRNFILLRQILGTRYLQDATSDGDPPIDISLGDDPLEASLTGVSEDMFIRLAKFERLRTKLAWTPRELHQGIMLFAGASAFVEDLTRPGIYSKFPTEIFKRGVLRPLSHIERLRRQKDCSVMELLSWWGPMESGAGFRTIAMNYQEESNHKTLYEKVFLDSTLYRKGDGELDTAGDWPYFQLNASRTELQKANQHSITKHTSLVAAALRISKEQLLELINFLPSEHRWINQPYLDNVQQFSYYTFSDSLNLRNLSVLYKVVSMARYLEVSLEEFRLVYRILGLDLFKVQGVTGLLGSSYVAFYTQRTILFIEAVQQIRRSPFSIHDLAYLWQHRTEDQENWTAVQQRIRQLMEGWKFGLEVPAVEQLDPHLIILQGMHHPDHVALQKEHSAEEIEDFKAILNGSYLGVPGVELATEQKEQLRQRVLEIFPNHTLQGDERKEASFELMISHFSSARRGGKSNWMYATVMGALIRLSLPDTFARHHQDLVLDFIDRFGYSDDTIPKIKASLDQHGLIAHSDEDLVNSLSQKIQQLMDRLPAILPEPLHLPTLRSYIFSSFFGRDVFVDESFPRFIHYLSGTLEKLIYWEAELANFTGLSEEMIPPLLHSFLPGTREDSYLYDDLVRWLRFEPEVSDEIIHQHLVRLDKIGVLVKEWGLSSKELEYLAGAKTTLHGFDWKLIPVKEDDPPLSFEAWRSLQAYVALRNQISQEEGDLLVLFQLAEKEVGSDAKGLFENLAFLLDEDYTTVKAMAAHLGYLDIAEGQLPIDGLLLAGACFNAESIWPLLQWQRRCQQARSSTSVLERWVEQGDYTLGAAFTEDTVGLLDYKQSVLEEIRRTAKERSSQEQWQKVARQFRDRMRILQRDHLLAAILANEPELSVEGLYGRLLIDAEMNPCMNTTRLKQAISSVQLYIHRLLMGFESNTSGLDVQELQTHWNWKKNYRLWEAQRKVFLYPENWIEPELRDNKTPFFEEFEGELAQSEISEQSIEKAWSSYLLKMQEVANLEIVAFAEDRISEPKELHVLGRTRKNPHRLFYRKQNGDGQWMAWQKVEVEVDSEVILLTVYRGYPYIFWPSIKKTVQRLGQDNSNDESNERSNYLPVLEITFNWSKFENGKWTPRKKNEEPCRIMYGWSYKDLFGEVEKILMYKIHSYSNRILIRLGLPSNNLIVNEERYTWNQNKLDEIFDELENLPNKIDWNYIIPDNRQGNIFDEYKVELVTNSVRNITQAAKQEIVASLYRHDNRENRNYLKDVGKTIDLLRYFLITFPEQFPNDRDSSSEANNPDGIRIRDEDTVVETTNKLQNFDDASIGLYNKNYKYLEVEDTQLDTEFLKRVGEVNFKGFELSPEVEKSYGLAWTKDPQDNYNYLPLLPSSNILIYSSLKEPFTNIRSFDSNFLYYQGYYLKFQNPDIQDRFFFHNEDSCYLLGKEDNEEKYVVDRFYHPWIYEFADSFINQRLIGTKGKFNEMLTLSNQDKIQGDPSALSSFDIQEDADQTKNQVLSFDLKKPFALYNWEIFFHMPFMIACRLSENKKFEQAQKWFHYIFNPFGSFSLPQPDTTLPPASRYWNVIPLHQLTGVQSMQDIWNDPEERQDQLEQLAADPFQPHRMARYRPSTYQKAVVMKYLDNILAWGDHLFERDTLESINEATLLYVLASRILGPRPRKLPAKQPATSRSELRADNASLKVLNNPAELAAIEQKVLLSEKWKTKGNKGFVIAQGFPLQQWNNPSFSLLTKADSRETVGELTANGIPHNEKLLSYWDTVADRLFKIRHCQNIEGITRELPIFEPPIDPGFLVRGAALGVDISDLLSDLYAPLPPYRFRFMLQKANEFCGDVRSLGGALLSALEKKDGEELSLLRTKHEQQMLKLTQAIKKQQIRELRENLKATRVSLGMAEGRYEYYNSKKFENPNEKQHVRKLGLANDFNLTSQIMSAAAAVAYAAPDFITNMVNGVSEVKAGGKMIGDALKTGSDILGIIGAVFSNQANMHSIQASRERRWEDWQFQAEQAQKEIKQVSQQLLAAEIRLAIAEQELTNHEKQLEQSQEIEAFMRSKFTNQQLYQWMIGQTSTLYFQTYKLAMELARTAQRCYRFERGDESATFIGAAYWDNLKKGLLAGEKLQLDLRRMEQEHLSKNTRELELTKHISLKALDPRQLHFLRYQGSCTVNIPELLFDLDFPGQYYRRIKSLSVSIPAVVGPYSGMNCTLRLNSSYTRKVAKTEDSAWTLDQAGAPKEIALSSGQNDSGLFELNYNDERYLPFELRGVQSNWTLAFPGTLEQFDRTTISDVILHVRYTARQGGDTFRDKVDGIIRSAYEDIKANYPLFHQVDIRRTYMADWHQWVSVGTDKLQLQVGKDHFPYLLRPVGPQIHRAAVFCEIDPSFYTEENVTEQPDSIAKAFTINGLSLDLNSLHKATDRWFFQSDFIPLGEAMDLPGNLEIILTSGDFEHRHLKEMLIVFQLFESAPS